MEKMNVYTLHITPTIHAWMAEVYAQVHKRCASTYDESQDRTEPTSLQLCKVSREDIESLVQDFNLYGGFRMETSDWHAMLSEPENHPPYSITNFLRVMTKHFPDVHKEPLEIAWLVNGRPGAMAIFKGFSEEMEGHDPAHDLALKLLENLRLREMGEKVQKRLSAMTREEVAEALATMVDQVVIETEKRLRLRAVDMNDVSLVLWLLHNHEDVLVDDPRLSKLFED